MANDGRVPDALLGAIYETVLEPAEWANALGDVAAALGAKAAGIVVLDEAGASAIGSATAGIDPRAVEAYRQHYGSLDPVVRALARAAPGRVHADHELLDRRAYERGSFHNEWAARTDMTAPSRSCSHPRTPWRAAEPRWSWRRVGRARRPSAPRTGLRSRASRRTSRAPSRCGVAWPRRRRRG